MFHEDLPSNEDQETEKIDEIGIQLNKTKQETIEVIPNALVLIPILLVMLQHQKKELDLKTNENDLLKTENNVLKDELEWSKKEIKRVECPLVSLPDELIGYIWSFLEIKDRMRARVCNKLDNIEFSSETAHPREKNNSQFVQRATDDHYRFNITYITNHKQYFVLLKENVYSIDFFKRLIRNAKFGYLTVNNESLEQSLVVDSFLLDLKNSCCKLTLPCAAVLTASGIYLIYAGIKERSSKMNWIDFILVEQYLLHEFLQLVGIRFEDGNLFSARDIEAYEFKEKCCEEIDCPNIFVNKHVFDGNLEMKFGQGTYDGQNEAWLSLKCHQSNEDLQKAKTTKGFVRIAVNPQ